MSRPESNPEPIFKIINEESLVPKLSALPLNLRKQALESFDKEFTLADRHSPSHSEIDQTITQAQAFLLQGELSLAKNLFRSAVRLQPQSIGGLRGLALCAREQGQHEEAIGILKKITQTSPTQSDFRLLGDECYALSYFVEAQTAYTAALQFPEENPAELFNIYKNLGNISLKMGMPNEAETYYNKAYALNPDSDVLLVNYASLSLFRGDYDKALVRFREAVRLNDKNDKAWVGLAMIHREYGDAELAWANVEKALDIFPGQESAIKLVVDWAMKDNEIDKAIIRLTNYLDFHPKDALQLMMLAKFLYFAGHLQLALKKIENALHLEPHLPDAAEVAGVIKSELNLRSNNNA